jgi:hypothetical protein
MSYYLKYYLHLYNVFLYIYIISFDDTYDGNSNRVVTAEYFKIKPFVLAAEINYNLLYKVIRPTSKIPIRFLITLFRNFYKGAVIK